MLDKIKLIIFIVGICLFPAFFPPLACGENQTDISDLFQQTCADLARNAEKSRAMTVIGKDNWLFLASELRHLGLGQFWGEAAPRVSRATGAYSAKVETATQTKPEATDPLSVILDFNDQLKKIGVELIVVPVPPKAIVYSEMLPGFTRLRQDSICVAKATPGYAAVPPGFTNQNETARLDYTLQEFYALLRSKGVKVLDLTDFFLQNKKHSQGPLYCRQDSHWSGNGCVLAAEKIAAGLRPFLGGSDRQTNSFKSDWPTIEINGDLRQALGNKDIPRERLRVRKISKPGTDEPVEPDAESKIILLGDSHNLVFHSGEDMLFGGAGLSDQLAFELGAPVDLVAVRGSGATPARINLMRRAQQRKDYWTNKKCVIWCFSAREFTESDGWRKVPIVPKKIN